jgi:hypothetical protein
LVRFGVTPEQMLRAVCVLCGCCALSIAGCRRAPEPLTIAVSFQNSWTFDGATLTEAEIAIVKSAAFDTLRDAYAGFRVQFIEAASGPRVVTVEDTPYSSPMYLGATGITYAASFGSSVRADVLFRLMLSAAACPDFTMCPKPRDELLRAFGRGLGATAAHELGHQTGFRFARDARCDDCFDGHAASSVHFFGRKHWSPEATVIMRRVLPTVPGRD